MPSPVPGVAPLEQGGFASANPLGLVNDIAGLQLRLNENRNFQMQFHANQAAGEIIANAPDLDTAEQQLEKSGMAGWLGPTMQNLRAMKLIGAQTREATAKAAGAEMQNATSGWQAVTQSLAAGFPDYRAFGPALTGRLNTLPPEVRKTAMESLKGPMEYLVNTPYDLSNGQQISYADALKTKNPQVRAEVQQEWNKRALGLYAGGSGTAEGLMEAAGTSDVVNGIPGVHQPSALGGGYKPAQEAGTAPAQPGGLASGQMPTGAAAPTSRLTGQPMQMDIPDYFLTDSRGNPMQEVGGGFKLKPGFEDKEKAATADFAKEKDEYDAAQNMSGTLAQMSSAAQRLAASGGWYATGFGGSVRNEISQMVEALQRMGGGAVDPKLIQADVDSAIINKNSRQLASQIEHSLHGEGRQAYGLFEQFMTAVPGLDTSPLGFKILSSSLQAIADYTKDKYDYKTQWAFTPKSQGHVFGADQQFNKQTPPLAYLQKEMADNGIDLQSGGFRDRASLDRALNAGLLGTTDPNNEHFAETGALYKQLYKRLPKAPQQGQP